jgi:hypothetical protein
MHSIEQGMQRRFLFLCNIYIVANKRLQRSNYTELTNLSLTFATIRDPSCKVPEWRLTSCIRLCRPDRGGVPEAGTVRESDSSSSTLGSDMLYPMMNQYESIRGKMEVRDIVCKWLIS